MKRGQVKISQCMIVKNEEKNIEHALSWGAGIVSEQIVVDTGSTDRTMDIARRMGAKVYEFPWIDDFSAAKNFAISKARYEWIAFLDADEYLAPEHGKKVLEYVEMLQDTEAESLLTAWVNLDNEGNVKDVGTQSRIFKRHLRYKGRIHEHLAVAEERLLQVADVTEDVTIYHTGYGEREEKKKRGRNLKLILLELDEHPDSYEMWGYLGQEHMAREEWEQAEEALKRAVTLIPLEGRGVYDITLSVTMLRLLQVLIHRKADEAEILQVYGQATKDWPEEADYDYLLARYFAGRGDFIRGEQHLKQGIGILDTYGTACKSMVLAGEIRHAYELLAVCCYNNQNLTDAIRYTAILLKEDPWLMSTLTLMLRTFSRDPAIASKGEGGAQQVVLLLEHDFYDFSSLKDRLFVFQAAMASGYEELVEVIGKRFTEEELAAVEQALHIGN